MRHTHRKLLNTFVNPPIGGIYAKREVRMPYLDDSLWSIWDI